MSRSFAHNFNENEEKIPYPSSIFSQILNHEKIRNFQGNAHTSSDKSTHLVQLKFETEKNRKRIFLKE